MGRTRRQPRKNQPTVAKDSVQVEAFKFAVDAEGKLVYNGIATANKLGSDRVSVPVHCPETRMVSGTEPPGRRMRSTEIR